MNKYKLINKQTNQEHICDKVTIDGFDYYVSNQTVKKEDGWCWDDRYKRLVTPEKNLKTSTHDADFYWKIIACNNPKIDIPKVVDEVELAKLYSERGIRAGFKSREEGFINGYNKSQETHPFSEEDILEFMDWYKSKFVQIYDKKTKLHQISLTNPKTELTTKELFEIWKEQQPKIVYYE